MLRLSPFLALASFAFCADGLKGSEFRSHRLGGGGSGGAAKYSSNNMCVPSKCINPIFPALATNGSGSLFHLQKKKQWACVKDNQAHKLTKFCAPLINGYNFAVPKSEDGAILLPDVLRAQDREAISSYVAHVAGLGLDLWQFREPWKSNDCMKSIWKIACFAHFPKCSEFSADAYLKPCKSSCQNYMRSCGVECCDEGVQCVFEHTEKHMDGTVLIEEGFEDHLGPSPMCTGGSLRRLGGLAWMLAVAHAAFVRLAL